MSDGILKKMPNDFVIDILSRLSVKLLLRFKCVSKIWYTFVESTTFINIHFNHATNNKNEFVVVKRYTKEAYHDSKSVLSFFSVGPDDYDLHFVSPEKISPYTCRGSGPFKVDRLIGTCHGLIVLTDGEKVVVFDPTTRNYRLIKTSPFGSLVGLHRHIRGMGFGFDSIANEYKIVKLAELVGDPPFYCYTMEEWRLEVYELSTDSWREFNLDQQFPNVYWCTCAELFYKGASHWFGNTNTNVILSFDMSTEIFRSIKMPNTCLPCYGIIVLNESLSLICYPNESPTMEIWVMKEYGISKSWHMKYKITSLAIKTPLAVWKDHLLFFESISDELMSYDLNSEDVKEFNIYGWPDTMRVIVFKKSLTLILKGIENIHTFKNFRED